MHVQRLVLTSIARSMMCRRASQPVNRGMLAPTCIACRRTLARVFTKSVTTAMRRCTRWPSCCRRRCPLAVVGASPRPTTASSNFDLLHRCDPAHNAFGFSPMPCFAAVQDAPAVSCSACRLWRRYAISRSARGMSRVLPLHSGCCRTKSRPDAAGRAIEATSEVRSGAYANGSWTLRRATVASRLASRGADADRWAGIHANLCNHPDRARISCTPCTACTSDLQDGPQRYRPARPAPRPGESTFATLNWRSSCA